MLKKDTMLRFWCQKVLPLVYDDSLSYYELLNKVVLHLNQHTEDINALIDFYDTFSEDVEDIIHQMMEDGEFNEIVADTLGSIIAEEYDPTSISGYNPLDYVIHESKLYCATDSTSGDWDSTKWRECTVGDELNNLMTRVYGLNAGQVSYDETATYNSGTVGKALKDVIADVDGLTANEVVYNSSATYDNSTVGKELRDLNTAITSLQTVDTAIENGLAIVAIGNTHPAIAKDRYVYIKGHGTLAEGLYKASETIPLNGTLSSTNVTAISNGGLNQLLEENFTVTSPDITWASGSFCNCKKIGNIIMISGGITPAADAPEAGWTNAALIPEGYRPSGNVFGIGFNYDGSGIIATYAIRVQAWGGLQIMQLHNNETCFFDFFYFI